ncbi:hypothetical protein C1701_05765 [Actinoalloteichus sp. AHMU CJ021]|nr:hypothetical protein C1701_05765 [Actinoalloteichus sp. AHMU CJ021]
MSLPAPGALGRLRVPRSERSSGRTRPPTRRPWSAGRRARVTPRATPRRDSCRWQGARSRRRIYRPRGTVGRAEPVSPGPPLTAPATTSSARRG